MARLLHAPIGAERAKTSLESGGTPAASEASAVARPEVVRASAAPGLNHKLRTGTIRPRLRVKGVRTHPSVWEVTWADDGRATFRYGESRRPGDSHIIGRRVGSHDIFQGP